MTTQNKLKILKQLLQYIKINGLENYPTNNPSVIIANHSCLKDIFYLPAALDKPSVSLISPRLIYKEIPDRQELINQYLYSMPIEAHGGKTYSDICLDEASKILQNNISINIFPEGAYIEDSTTIHRGRTGAARILFDARENGINVNLVPVAIKINNPNIDLDNYAFNHQDDVEIIILPQIPYGNEFDKFISSQNQEQKNEALHSIIDKGMQNISETLNKKYIPEYIELFPKGNVIFEDGNTIPIEQAQNYQYINKYKTQLQQRSKQLINEIKNTK